MTITEKGEGRREKGEGRRAGLWIAFLLQVCLDATGEAVKEPANLLGEHTKLLEVLITQESKSRCYHKVRFGFAERSTGEREETNEVLRVSTSLSLSNVCGN